MAEKYPKDRFDTAPEHLQRVGAHRSPRRRGRGWIGFLWALLAVVVLVGLGILGLFVINGNVNFSSLKPGGTASATAPAPASTAPAPSHTPSRTPSSTPTPEPTVDPNLNVTVLNGTPARGVAAAASKTLTADGWHVATVGNASRGDYTETVVYYSDPANKEAALGLVRSLTGTKATAVLSQAYATTTADLTVVLGSDYNAGTR